VPTILKNLADNTTYLSEKVANAEVEKTEKNLKVIHAVLIDPNTGKALGASDFFPTLKNLDFTQAGAVQNTWYTAFSGTNIQHFAMLGVGITVANETVELRITIDGVVYSQAAGIALLFATTMLYDVLGLRTVGLGMDYIYIGAAATSLLPNGTVQNYLRGQNVKVEVRKTTAGGASALRVLGYYF
jgi:hypothetical protein